VQGLQFKPQYNGIKKKKEEKNGKPGTCGSRLESYLLCQEDRDSKPAWANSSRNPISKIPTTR
jgi:hypothetical protein